jgi:protein-disulfide isomerase
LKIKEALRGLIGNADKASAYKYFIALLASLVFSVVIGFGSEPLVVIMKDEYLREQNEHLARQSMEKFGQERAVVIDISSRPVMGDPKAPVTIAEFSDFFCPHCAVTAEVLREVLVDNPGKVRVVFFNFPLDIDCNPVMTRQLHQGACIIARGASCAARQAKFEQYYNFSFQLKMERATFNTAMQIAQYAGADMTRFQSCMMSPESQNDLRQDLTAANSLSISSTPRLFVNGKSVSGPFTRELLNQIIMKELADSR